MQHLLSIASTGAEERTTFLLEVALTTRPRTQIRAGASSLCAKECFWVGDHFGFRESPARSIVVVRVRDREKLDSVVARRPFLVVGLRPLGDIDGERRHSGQTKQGERIY